jgi:hypothetical protein
VLVPRLLIWNSLTPVGAADEGACHVLASLSHPLLPHELDRSQKPLLKIVKIGLSNLANRRVRFCRDQ